MTKTSFFTRLLSVLLMVCLLLTELGPSLAWAAETDDGDMTQEAADTAEIDGSDENASQETEEDGSDMDAASETEGESSDEDIAEDTSDTDISDDSADENAASETGDADDSAGEESTETVSEEDDTLAEEKQAEQDAMAQIESVLATAMVSDETDYDYATELAKFPESYQTYLKKLHETYPNWIFVAVDTGLSWDDVVNGEYGSNSTIDYNLNGTTDDLLLNNHSGYYSSSSYSSTNHYKPIDGNHVSASRAAVAYYMDPRNFLTAKYIFQFEDQTYSSVQQLSGVQKVLKNAADSSSSSSKGLYYTTKYVNTSGETVSLSSLNSIYGSDYSSIIYNVGVATDVSPYYLASKIVQETGAVTTNQSISGTVSGYVGYYNFYNIGATASTTGTAVLNGLAYAKNHGWYNPILALYGGAEFLASSYISKGQNTSYYMRFNVSPDRYYSAYSHQYMSATYAVASESITTYNAYNASGAVSSAFLFYIPVFDDMPDKDSTVRLSGTNTGTTTTATTLYSSPSMSSSVVSVPKGTTVTVLGGYQTESTGYTERLYYPYWYQVKVTVSGTTYTGYLRESQVSLSSAYTIKTGNTKSISSTLTTTGDAGTIYYETSDPSVATVSDSGVITAVAAGTCTIYAISGAGSFDAIGVTVSDTASTVSLSTPTLTSASNATSGITVKWGAVSDADSYRVYRKVSGGSWSLIATVSTTSYTDTAATAGTTYIYTVRAVNGSTLSGYSSTGVTCMRLTNPSLTSATASSSGITVKWGAVTGAKGYLVYRKVSGGSWSRIATISSSSTVSYTDKENLISGTTYIYTVRAVNGSYLSYYSTSGISAKATITTTTLSTPVLTSASNATSGITVKWGAVSNATKYRVYRKVSGGSWSTLTTITGTSYTDTTASSGTTYIYTVRAINDSNISGYDSTGVTCIRLTNPSLTSATASSSGITVKWGAVTGAKGYLVYRKVSGGSWSRIATISSSSTVSYTDKENLISGTTYIYTVRAVNGSYLSYYSTSGISAKATITTTTLSTPVLTSASNATSGITVKWGAVSNATKYRVYRKVSGGSWSTLTTITGTSYTDTTASSGTTYIYTVRAINDSNISGYDSTGVTCIRLTNPSLTSATASSSGITVKWGAVTGAKGYLVYRKISGGSWSRIATISSGSTVSYTDNASLVSGTTYIYTVRAVNGSYLSYYSTSGISAQMTASTSVSLSTPSLVYATNATSGITVKWGIVTNATGYRIYRKVSGGSWSKIGTVSDGSTVSYTDTSAVSGTTYIYTVRAVNSSGISGYDSTGVTCIRLSNPSLTSATASSSGITVKWGSVTGAKGYLVYRKVSGGSWSRIATISSGSTVSYTDNASLASDTTYIYTVRAVSGSYLSYYNTSGISATAASSSASYDSYVTIGMLNYRTGPGSSYSLGGTLSAGTTVRVVSGETYDVSGVTWYRAYINGGYYYVSSRYLLKTPSLSSAANATSGVTVKWAKVTNATGYRVYRKVSGGSWSQIGTVSSGSTVSYTDTSAASGTTYIYTVRAVYTTSSGTILSGYDSTGVTCIRLSNPSLTSATATSSGITVKWAGVTGAKGYRVYRKVSGGSWSRIATISSSATLSYTDNTGLISGTTYIYTVRAVSGSYLSYYNSTGVSAKATASSTPTLVDYVTTGMLNYRTGPGTSYTLAGTFASGATVKVVDGESYDVSGTVWYRVYVNGSYYYCSSQYLKKA
ncbi:MAG: SH3 domain-containing protein [Clostridiales bacterium]|nr:SH3 domain-containing protein [Clostridiales bacterium]